jgi:hypothetical protein
MIYCVTICVLPCTLCLISLRLTEAHMKVLDSKPVFIGTILQTGGWWK